MQTGELQFVAYPMWLRMMHYFRSSGGVFVQLLACGYDFRDWLSSASKSLCGCNIA